MKARGVHLQYSFEADGQRGADVHNPLFDLLSSVHEHGSIQHAARSLGASYRHVWGALKRWEETLGEPLVTWAQGQPARLTPFAERDFGITGPKIAILGLNPHAGDGGTLSSEDKERILPAVRKLNEEGIIAMGPYPADGFFGNGSYKHFDGVLAMYHDQGLAPFKALSFGHGVNYTAGLPVVRTSPDHGTGLDIAGKGIANEGSFRHAVWLACDILRNREAYKAMTANPLQAQKREKGRRDE